MSCNAHMRLISGGIINMFRRLLFVLLLVIVLSAALFATAASAQGYCYGAPPPRLQVNTQAMVTPGLPNALRTQPFRGPYSTVIGWIPGGSVFSVIGGPSCGDGMYWWQISYNGLIGWTPEGSPQGEYWLQPYSYIPPTPIPSQCPLFPLINLIGYTGRVTAGLPNNLRATPSMQGAYLASIPAFDTFIYVGGPVCSEGTYWWQINYRGMIGWTSMGGSGSWIEPVVCPGFTNSRLAVGLQARVTPGLPNNLRVYPTRNSYVQTIIPAGTVMSVIEGPDCEEGTAWWRVRFGRYVGWTAEGQGYTYWLEPS